MNFLNTYIDKAPIMEQAVKISIIEDSSDYRSALRAMIDSMLGYTCISTYANGESALERIGKNVPDIVLVDIGLPGIDGLEVIQRIKEQFPKIQFMVLTVSEEGDKIFNALSLGASGYLLKSTPPSKIISAIKELVDGGSPMSSKIARKVVESFQQRKEPKDNPYEKLLTTREKQVLHELSNGLMYKEIAAKLHVSKETIKSHCHNIYEKLHVKTKVDAINTYYHRK